MILSRMHGIFSRQKGCGLWWLAWKILCRWEMCIPIIGFAISFSWLIFSGRVYLQLYNVMAEPAVIRGEIDQLSDDRRLYIASLKGVRAVTKLMTCEAGINFDEYTGTVAIYGVEDSYFRQLTGGKNMADIAFSQGMPYGILCQSAAIKLKKSEAALILSDDRLLEDFKVNDTDVRLYGWIEDVDNGLNGTDLSGLYVLEEWYDKLIPSDSVSSPDGAGGTEILVLTEHGWQAPELIRQLGNIGVSGTSQADTLLAEANEASQKYLYTGSIVGLCSLLICIYREKLWKEKYRIWMEMLERFYHDSHIRGKLLRRQYFMLFVISLLGSVIWQWISFVFEL